MPSVKLTQIELVKKQVQIEIIRSCILKSRAIIIGNAIKQSLRNATFFINRFPYLLQREGEISNIINNLDEKVLMLKRHISISLKNIIGYRDIRIEDLFWFSAADLKSGYVLLYPHYHTRFANNVLFLVEAKDPFDNSIYFPGDIYPFEQVKQVLTSIKGLTDRELGIGFNYASRSELLTELSNLQSIINNQNHERDIIP